VIRYTGVLVGIESQPRREVSYWCVKGHHTPCWWSAQATAPDLWECRRCGLPAGQDPAHPPEPLAVPQSKTPMGHLLERRTEAECEALLTEALQRLRTRRQARARGRQSRGSWS
jgi:hypothetical protein